MLLFLNHSLWHFRFSWGISYSFKCMFLHTYMKYKWKTYNCIVFTDFQHTKLYPFQNLSLGFILKILLKFQKFEPRYSFKMYSYIYKKSVSEKFLCHFCGSVNKCSHQAGRSIFHVDMTKYPVYTDIDTHMVQTLLIYRSLNILGLLVSKNGRIWFHIILQGKALETGKSSHGGRNGGWNGHPPTNRHVLNE